MYLLMRLEGLRHPPALIGAIAFEMMPKFFGHYGAGHVTLLYAVSWTPWLLYAARKRITEPCHHFTHILEALVMAAICLADIRWTIYAGAAWWIYCLAVIYRGGIQRRIVFFRQGVFLTLQTCLAALLSAILWVPMLEFLPLSSRLGLTSQDTFIYSLPPSRLLGLVFPDLGGFHEWIVYSGVLVFSLSLLAVVYQWSKREVRFWFLFAVGAWIFALGAHFPVLHFIARLPGFSLLRVPSRSLFLSGMSLAILAAYAIQHITSSVSDRDQKWSARFLVGLNGFVLIFLTGLGWVSQKIPGEFLLGGVLLLAGSLWIWMKVRSRVGNTVWLVGVLGLCLLDWGAIDSSVFTIRSKDQVFSEGSSMAGELSKVPGDFRVYSPSYSLPQQTAANFDLQLSDGVDPLQLQAYVDFMQMASGVPLQGYSVTLPPFATGNPPTDNAAYAPNARLLGWLNVQFVAAEYDLDSQGLELRGRFGETRLYENLQVLPRAWVQPSDTEIGTDAQPVDDIEWSPERIEIVADGPGLLVLSELNYPGWRVQIDGESAQIQEVGQLLRGVILKPGRQKVIFHFLPASLFWGASLCLLGIGLCILIYRANWNPNRE